MIVPRSLPLCIVSLTSFVFEHSACIVSTVNRRSEKRTQETSLTYQLKPKIIDRKSKNPEAVPEGSVCSVRKRNPRISESAIFETQFLFPVVLEITCHWTETLMSALPCHQQNQLLAIFTMDKVRTDFWIQNSRLFRDFFPKTIILFPHSRLSNRWLIQTLKNAGTKLVFTMQTYRRDWIRFDQNDERKKKTLIKHLLWLWKKTQDFLPFFQTLSLFSRRFPDLENCWANFKTFSIIQDSVQHCMDVCILDVILQYEHPKECHWS